MTEEQKNAARLEAATNAVVEAVAPFMRGLPVAQQGALSVAAMATAAICTARALGMNGPLAREQILTIVDAGLEDLEGLER